MNGKRPPAIPLLVLQNNKSGNRESAYLDQPALQGVIPWYRPHIPEDVHYGIYMPDLLVGSFNHDNDSFNLFKEIFLVSRVNNKKDSEK